MSITGIATCIDPDLEAELLLRLKDFHTPMQLVRRCRDYAEVLSIARAQLVELLVLDSERIDLNPEAEKELLAAGLSVLILAPLDDVPLARDQYSFDIIQKEDPRVPAAPTDLCEQILQWALARILPPPPPNQLEIQNASIQEIPTEDGKIMALWGPVGAPGRSTLALNLAANLRSYGRVILVDGDTVEPSQVQLLAVELRASGVVNGCRLAEQAQLCEETFAPVVTNVGAGVDLLSGITKAERWREVSEDSFATLLEWLRKHYRWIVVDLAPGASDPDEALMTLGPSRYSAQDGTFAVADLVLEVGTADPVGMRRLIVNHVWAGDKKLWQCPSLAVVNRGRASVAGSNWETSIRRALSLADNTWEAVVVRQATQDFDKALVAGCDIATVNPSAPVLEDFDALQSKILSLLGILPRRGATRRLRARKGKA